MTRTALRCAARGGRFAGRGILAGKSDACHPITLVPFVARASEAPAPVRTRRACVAVVVYAAVDDVGARQATVAALKPCNARAREAPVPIRARRACVAVVVHAAVDNVSARDNPVATEAAVTGAFEGARHVRTLGVRGTRAQAAAREHVQLHDFLDTGPTEAITGRKRAIMLGVRTHGVPPRTGVDGAPAPFVCSGRYGDGLVALHWPLGTSSGHGDRVDGLFPLIELSAHSKSARDADRLYLQLAVQRAEGEAHGTRRLAVVARGDGTGWFRVQGLGKSTCLINVGIVELEVQLSVRASQRLHLIENAVVWRAGVVGQEPLDVLRCEEEGQALAEHKLPLARGALVNVRTSDTVALEPGVAGAREAFRRARARCVHAAVVAALRARVNFTNVGGTGHERSEEVV
eukprot:2940937-Rhodomonas_salina.1